MMETNKKIAVVITDGVGFRNFVMSDFLSQIARKFHQVTIYSGLPKEVYDGFLPEKNIKIYELDVFYENKITWFFRKWKEIAHLTKFKQLYGMKSNLILGYPISNSINSIIIKILYFFTKHIHSTKSILFAEKLQFLSFSNHEITKTYQKLIEEDRPHLVFFTHQRPSFLAPLLATFHKNKIPTTTFIFSWDNLTSKGRMLGNFDDFLVWSDLMKTELQYFYNTPSTNIHIVGTPQFEPYVLDRYVTTKSDFYKKFGLTETKKIICFSCADISIGANDGLIIETIAQAIKEQKIHTEVQFLVRTSPAEDALRFAKVKADFPEIIWNEPSWVLSRTNHAEAWSQRIPTQEDIMDLRSILEFSDLNINMCSTMSLDFMLFDKPVINTVFGNKTNGLYDDQRFLYYDHFKKVVDSDAVKIAKNANELIDAINFSLENPTARIENQKKIVQLQISKPLENTSQRIAETLAKIANV
jgi:hypothetical protein